MHVIERRRLLHGGGSKSIGTPLNLGSTGSSHGTSTDWLISLSPLLCLCDSPCFGGSQTRVPDFLSMVGRRTAATVAGQN
jgi:hypothetical protein